MNEVLLAGREGDVETALDILTRAFLSCPDKGPKKCVVTHEDTSNLKSNPLKSSYMAINSVFVEQSPVFGCNVIVRPFGALDIIIPANPRTFRDGKHASQIELHGDFLTVTVPYQFYHEPSEPEYMKWSFFLNCTPSSDEAEEWDS